MYMYTVDHTLTQLRLVQDLPETIVHFEGCPSFIFMAPRSLVGQRLLIVEASRSQTYHTLQDYFGRVISPKQRPLPDKSQLSQETHTHTSDGIRTRNPSKRAATDRRIRPRGHCHWQCPYTYQKFDSPELSTYSY
jgi:hypothetical protein